MAIVKNSVFTPAGRVLTHPITGADANADALPTAYVTKDDDVTAPLTGGLTVNDITAQKTGLYTVTIDTSHADYVAASSYNLFLVGVVGGETNTVWLFSFSVASTSVVAADVVGWDGVAVPTPAIAGVPEVNASYLADSAVAASRLALFSEYQDYEGGLVWLKIPGGAPGDTDYENGTKLNPVDNMADAITIAGSIPGISGFRPLPGSIVTLTQDFSNTLFQGLGWTLVTAGFDLSNCRIFEAFVNGGISTSDTQNAFFIDSIIWSHTIGSAVLRNCNIANDMTLGEASSYTLINCSDAQAITQAAIDFNFLGGATVQMDRWSGALEIKNMAAGDELNIYGDGGVIINASCTGGTINRAAGNFPVEDNASGAVTIANELGRFSVDRLASAADITLIINYVRGRKILDKSGAVWSLIVYDHTDDVTPIITKAIKDLNGNDIDDLVAGQLAMELKSSV